MNDMERVMAILTQSAQRLIRAEPHSVPGEAKTMLAALQQHAVKLTEDGLITVERLSEFLIASGTSLASVILMVPALEQERILYLRQTAREYREQQAALATV